MTEKDVRTCSREELEEHAEMVNQMLMVHMINNNIQEFEVMQPKESLLALSKKYNISYSNRTHEDGKHSLIAKLHKIEK